jgi:hypothetical protein
MLVSFLASARCRVDRAVLIKGSCGLRRRKRLHSRKVGTRVRQGATAFTLGGPRPA